MKKLISAILLATVCTTPVFAAGNVSSPNSCGYSDYFHLGKDSIKPTIASLKGDANIIVVQENTENFYVRDTASCPPDGGVASVRYQKDGDNYCDLSVHDGENMWDPEVQAVCHGSLGYAGITHDGIGKYSYSLGFYNSVR
jgi:hypothetical protein